MGAKFATVAPMPSRAATTADFRSQPGFDANQDDRGGCARALGQSQIQSANQQDKCGGFTRPRSELG